MLDPEKTTRLTHNGGLNGSGLLAAYLRRAVAMRMIPLDRCDHGRLSYRPLSASSLLGLLLWLLLPTATVLSALVFLCCQDREFQKIKERMVACRLHLFKNHIERQVS
jgi:hypothetical protein